MSFQRLFSSVTNLYERASKNFICQSKASLHHKKTYKFENNGTVKLSPKPIQTEPSRFASAIGGLPLKFISWRSKLRSFSKTNKTRNAPYLPPIQLNFEFERNNRRFGEQYVADKRADLAYYKNEETEYKHSTIFNQPWERSIGKTGWRTSNFGKISKPPYSLMMISQDENEQRNDYEELQKIIRPSIFYGQPNLRTGRTHKSHLIRNFMKQQQQMNVGMG